MSAAANMQTAPLPALSTSEAQPNDAARWDAFVEAHGDATFFHKYGWKRVIEKSFGHRTHYLMVETGGEIEGVFPLVHINSRLFGNALISMPFAASGGVLATSDTALMALQERACELADKTGVDYLEVRNRSVQNPEWPSKDIYVNFSREIASDHDANLSAIPRKQRAMVRKGIKAGLESEIDDEIDRFYDVYSQSYRNLGSPVFSRKLFKMIREEFVDESSILTITHRGKAVTSVMSYYFKDQVIPYFGGGTSQARSLYANDFMYWDLMCRSADKGVRIFDYGRSKRGTGAFSFKKNWGFEPMPLSYEYYLVKANDVPNFSPTNPKYQYFIEAWKRLPMPVANMLGPFLSRSLG